MDVAEGMFVPLLKCITGCPNFFENLLSMVPHKILALGARYNFKTRLISHPETFKFERFRRRRFTAENMQSYGHVIRWGKLVMRNFGL